MKTRGSFLPFKLSWVLYVFSVHLSLDEGGDALLVSSPYLMSFFCLFGREFEVFWVINKRRLFCEFKKIWKNSFDFGSQIFLLPCLAFHPDFLLLLFRLQIDEDIFTLWSYFDSVNIRPILLCQHSKLYFLSIICKSYK